MHNFKMNTAVFVNEWKWQRGLRMFPFPSDFSVYERKPRWRKIVLRVKNYCNLQDRLEKDLRSVMVYN